MQTLLWIALGLFIITILVPRKAAYPLGTAGWIFFALHWASQPVHYLAIDDYFNVALTVLVAIFCSYVGYVMWKKTDDLTVLVTKAAAIGGILYFSFAEFATLNHMLICAVASQTVLILNFLGVPAVQNEWNVLSLNGHVVEIILGCTGIESMALFLGVVVCVVAPPSKKLAAFVISVPIIYVLNVLRNAFVLTATGNLWFGTPENSFYVSHNIIAKMGSIGALILISLMVFKLLPELLDMIVNVFDLLKGGISRAS
jgi:archaeosortase A (PGF-CTERM-specific)